MWVKQWREQRREGSYLRTNNNSGDNNTKKLCDVLRGCVSHREKEERVQTFPCLAHIKLDRKNNHSFFACTVLFLDQQIPKSKQKLFWHTLHLHILTHLTWQQTHRKNKRNMMKRIYQIGTHHFPPTHTSRFHRDSSHTLELSLQHSRKETQITDTHKSRHRNYYFNNYVFINFHTLHFALFHNNKIGKMIIIFFSHNKCQRTWEDPFPFSAVACSLPTVTGISSLFLGFINNINNLLSRHLPFFRVPSSVVVCSRRLYRDARR